MDGDGDHQVAAAVRKRKRKDHNHLPCPERKIVADALSDLKFNAITSDSVLAAQLCQRIIAQVPENVRPAMPSATNMKSVIKYQNERKNAENPAKPVNINL